MEKESIKSAGRRTVELEAAALQAMALQIDDEFVKVVGRQGITMLVVPVRLGN